ncbi:hypothetical protein ACEPAG_6607 [Sanghuangporus baumii]
MNVIEDEAAGVTRDRGAGVHTRGMKDIVAKDAIHSCITRIGVVLRESPHKLWKKKKSANLMQVSRRTLPSLGFPDAKEGAHLSRCPDARRSRAREAARTPKTVEEASGRGFGYQTRDRRRGFTPIAGTADVGRGFSAPVAATTHAIPVARSASVRTHHRHHSSGHSTTAPLVHVHSRSHSGSATPVVQVAHSQYTNAAPVAVSRAPSSRHGHANEYYDDRVIPVARSSSRHGSSRYGDPALSRVSSSRHGHGHYRHARTHSRTPSEVYAAA